MLTAKVQCTSKEPVEGAEGEDDAVMVNFGAEDDATVNDWAVGMPHLTASVKLSVAAAEAYVTSGMYTLTLDKAAAE
jgi:hypothetical protein